MFDAFESWCAATGVDAVGIRQLNAALRARGLRHLHSNGSFWVGVSLKPVGASTGAVG